MTGDAPNVTGARTHPRLTFTIISLEKLGTGTLVRLEEFGYLMDDLEISLGCAAGWGEALTLLKFFLEGGHVYGEVPAV